MEHGTTLWIIASAREELEERVKGLTGADGGKDSRAEDSCFKSAADSFISSLAVHLLLAQWATDWRGYIRWLEQVWRGKGENRNDC
jgi:hypothetical protein